MTVTSRAKRYRAGHRGNPKDGEWLFACLGCGELGISSRRDQATCSAKCRVRVHRSRKLLDLANTMKVELAQIAHAKAVTILARAGIPGAVDVANEVHAGGMREAEIQDAIVPVYWAHVVALAEALK